MIRFATLLTAVVTATCVAAPCTLTVAGDARLEVPADQFSLTIGATSTKASVDLARAEVDRTMAALVEVVTDLGLTQHDEWHTGRYDITPQWKPRPRSVDATTWKPEIVGYSVRSNLSITSTRMDIPGMLVAKAAEAGANDIGSLHFALRDPRTSRQQAIRKAAQYAIADATSLADASSVELVQILRLTLDGANAAPPRPVEHAFMAGSVAMRAMDSDSAPTISGGMVTVTASVTAEWKIAPKNGAPTQQSGSTD
ncbi:MAG: SIMPL domain-containing protein [Phycisphaerales bacterium]|nr:SIMPL domain-containing protein [Phycisphaerales bacterium]